MLQRLHGVLAPVVTPFSDDGESIDDAKLQEMVERLIEDGVDGLVVNGSTGEFMRLSDAERRHAVETACAAAAGKVPVVAQTGALTTKDAVSLTRHAEASGAAAALVVPPYYGPLSDDGFRAYYAAVAEATALPMVIYNIPGSTGKDFTADWLVALAREIPNVRYLKESSGNMVLIGALSRTHGDEIAVLNGLDTLHLPALTMGAAGSIIGSANVVAREQVAISYAFQEGDLEKALDTAQSIFPLLEFLRRRIGYSSRVKCALEVMGVGVGPARPPGPRLDAAEYDEARNLLAKLGRASAPAAT